MALATTTDLPVSKPVLVFDSGIGGLTVLREARVLMPERGFIYVADDAGFPYGGWEEDGLRQRILSLFAQLLDTYQPEICIIACNTAFTLAGADLRAAFPDMTFVGTVPAIKPAAERTRSGLVSVLATPGTVKRAYTRDLIQSFASQCHVRLVGSENLARMAESWIRGESVSDDAVLAEISPCFIEDQGRRTDIVVLACTHYPLLYEKIRKYSGDKVKILSQGEIVATSLADYLQRHQEMAARCSKSGGREFYTTDDTDDFDRHASLFFGSTVSSKHLDLQHLVEKQRQSL